MKSLIALAGLLLFVVLGFVTFRVLDARREERLLIGWSNSLVWSALDTPVTPHFEAAVVSSGGAPGQWVVSGQVTYRNEAESLLERTYEAAIEQICAHDGRADCWYLRALSLDGSSVNLRRSPAAKDSASAKVKSKRMTPPSKVKATVGLKSEAERAGFPLTRAPLILRHQCRRVCL